MHITFVVVSGGKSMKTCLDAGLVLLELQPQFLKNTAYISRFIKNFRSQFRSFPILQYMRKIKLAIEKIHKNNAKDTVSNIQSGFPIHLGSGHDLELPSRQYFDYCLAKVLAHCQIMVRLVVCSKKCALYFIHFLQYGHFIEVSTMIIALLGHVWHQARQCLLRMDAFYNELQTYREMFPNQKSDSKEYSFPENLSKFIGDDWKEEVDVQVEQITAPSTTTALQLLSGRNEQDNMETTGQTITEPRPVASKSSKMMRTALSQEDDIGEAVSRDPVELKPVNKPEKAMPEVFGKKTLLKFLKTENELRIKGSSKRLTRNVSQFSWEKFRQKMERCNVDIKGVFDKEWAKLVSK